jgi:hypothetical protein
MARIEVTTGPAVLREFEDDLPAATLRNLLASFPGGDRATERLRATVGGDLDLAIPAHRRALLAWLRSWGCRHLRRADERRSSAALSRWWSRWSGALPSPRRSLVHLTPRDLAAIEPAYAGLASLVAAGRAALDGDVAVTFGDTAAAKALYALRPDAFPPWDEPIRRAFGTARADGRLYRGYLELTAGALRGCAERFGVAVDTLPDRLGRPSATPARLIDEYLWLRITRGA